MTTPRQLLLEKARLTFDEVTKAHDGQTELAPLVDAQNRKATATALEAVGDLADALGQYCNPWKCYCRNKPYSGKHEKRCQATTAALARYWELRAGEDGDG